MNEKPTILCVDDEPSNLKLLEAVLAPRNYKVVMATNGKLALDKLREHQIDLVLLDIMMPLMNGVEVCKEIKEDDRYRHIPVVMITSLNSKEDRIRCIEAGAEDFISKPFDQGEILARIKMLLKMKDLNDKLTYAYTKISAITSLGRRLMKNFTPLNFDFMLEIEHIVGELIKHGDDSLGRPQVIIVHFPEKRKDSWFMFEVSSGGLGRKEIKLDIDFDSSISTKADAEMVYCNEAEINKSEFYPVARKMENYSLHIVNVVSYLSSEFCIAAMNYGRMVTKYDASILESLVMQSLFLKSLSAQVRDTDDAFAYSIHTLARASEANNEDTGSHIIRVGEYCGLISEHLGMPAKFTGIIKLQSQMHDVGKIHIPSEILNKPGKLTAEEFEEMKRHTLYGAKILGDHIRFALAKEIALTHHERWNGGGYPHGLSGEQIPLSGRIMNIADQYDALRNKRVYKPVFDHETTFRIITEGDGRTMPEHFDPQVLQAFKSTHKQFEEIYETSVNQNSMMTNI